MYTVTIFENILSITNPKIVKLDSVLKAIKEGRYRDKVELIRGAETDEIGRAHV